MSETEIGDLFFVVMRSTAFVAGPLVAATMLVGTVIAVLQALTQIQEATLTFIPKIVALAAVAAMTSGFTYGQIKILTETIFSLIASGSLD